ncbi:hypothetical protein [Pyxidicoccus xibeiensis]|uniref:hypothetical protein n=1 Tax=Pyxidicoccus xibeiensis TaxID=2906759 RepID=UPI0020A7641B|nr:hypothetical protein [Pyxidicoccus xibeiensis]MCP3142902.1 hypothetical protein [Pyxidicoccus xibeiensis]
MRCDWRAVVAALSLAACTQSREAPSPQPAAGAQAPAAPAVKGPVRYVLVSGMKLRKELPSDSEVLMELPQGTACTLLKEPEQFALALHVSCLGKEGYIPTKGVGPDKPSVEEALAAAEKPDLRPVERLDHALRAIGMAPENAAALSAVKKHYLALQFDRLSKRDSGDELDWRPAECADPAKQDACLAEAALPGPPFTARTLERRGQDFLAIGARKDFLSVVLGTWKEAASGFEYAVHDQEFESLDVPVIRRALGLPPPEGASKPRWAVGRGERNSFSRQLKGSRLEAVEGDSRLVAIDLEENLPPGRDGKRADLQPFEALEVLLVDDFNQDGRDDALVQVYTVGNCCEPCYLFATVAANGKPLVTNSYCSGMGPPRVGTSDGKVTFTLDDEEGQKTFVLSGNKARLHEERETPLLDVSFEFTAEQLWKLAKERETSPGETVETLAYDLSGDGQDERIECTGWERWSALSCKVFLGGKQVGDVSGCKSLGVLPSMTQGMHDLACDRRKTFRWNGSSYP